MKRSLAMFALSYDVHHLRVCDVAPPVVDDGLVQLGPDQGLGAEGQDAVQLVHQIQLLQGKLQVRIFDMNCSIIIPFFLFISIISSSFNVDVISFVNGFTKGIKRGV